MESKALALDHLEFKATLWTVWDLKESFGKNDLIGLKSMKIEQVFGQSQSQRDDKPLISTVEMILGLLILALIIMFLLISLGYLSNSKKKTA
ncbi:hypothetical protein BGP_0177 [Beggiatoa sp. PS]|nr:hypothetical protein BGP_0177 [Beggiatoa sp. PS]